MIPKGLFIVCLTIIIVNARDVSTAYYWSSSADDVQFAERHCYPLLLVMGTFRTSILGFLFPSLASLVFRNSNGPLLYRSAAVVNLVPEVSVRCLINCGHPRFWNCNIIPLSLLMLLEWNRMRIVSFTREDYLRGLKGHNADTARSYLRV